ncbi:MAG: aminomethyl-transferring glycine dehydrogenase subunit GcvPA [Polyangiaceae bacterium]|jgi:glycine dehydrogenase subunit 1|nr:aminomethyl-transferring glycine dehydrogenase subunit GcvPA [Polyangiaceae bacterium]
MRYLPHTDQEIEQMLATIGVPSIDALFDNVPIESRLGRPLALEPGMDEVSLMRHLEDLAGANQGARMLSFMGAGIYDHHIPPAVDQLLLRGELYTAYTPYQAEVSQGTLQTIWEFQTITSEILGQPVANASMYDGASAAAEAALMARRLTKRPKVIVCDGVHPEYIRTIETYLSGTADDNPLLFTPVGEDGTTSIASIGDMLDDKTAVVVVGYPNFFGCVGDIAALADRVHAAGALLVTATQDPYALALVESPGAAGADISVAEGQALATSPSFGGPGVGLFACRGDRRYLQELPGRLVGETVDADGTRGYVLTLSTREQHIRRERATSNICTNHGLIALSMSIRVCLLGKQGFIEVAKHCLAKAEYLKKAIASLDGFTLRYPSTPTFNEFVVRVRGGNAAAAFERLAAHGVLAGIPLSRYVRNRDDELLLAVTEKHTRADLDRLVEAFRVF